MTPFSHLGSSKDVLNLVFADIFEEQIVEPRWHRFQTLSLRPPRLPRLLKLAMQRLQCKLFQAVGSICS